MNKITGNVNAHCDHVDFVLDMGTTRRLVNPPKSESFIPLTFIEWASQSQIDERKAMTINYPHPMHHGGGQASNNTLQQSY